jgi:hypothetical protein
MTSLLPTPASCRRRSVGLRSEPQSTQPTEPSGTGSSAWSGQNAEANADLGWESFFHDGPGLSDDALAERAAQEQAEREPF